MTSAEANRLQAWLDSGPRYSHHGSGSLPLSTLSSAVLAVIARFRHNKMSKEFVFPAVSPLSKNDSEKHQQTSRDISLADMGSRAHP